MRHGTPPPPPTSAGVRRAVPGQHRPPAADPTAQSRTALVRPYVSATGRPVPTQRGELPRRRRSTGAPPKHAAHRRTRARLPRRRDPLLPAPRTAQLLTKGLAIVIALSVTGLIGFLIVADSRRGHPAEASTTDEAALAADELRSRAVDPKPLAVEEVFPNTEEVRPSAGGPAYRLTMTHIDTECTIAAVGTLGQLLKERGCTQVVRAAMLAPYGDYQVTAGLFNLTDATAAATLDDQVRHLVETGDGGFASMAAGGPGTDPAVPPASQVGWRSRGHYLLYCVITRPQGQLIANGDESATRITAELIDNYLSISVLGRRTTPG